MRRATTGLAGEAVKHEALWDALHSVRIESFAATSRLHGAFGYLTVWVGWGGGLTSTMSTTWTLSRRVKPGRICVGPSKTYSDVLCKKPKRHRQFFVLPHGPGN